MKDVLLYSLTNYYSKDNNLSKLLNIIKYKKGVSLRVIDWFATNYSKKYNTIFMIYRNDNATNTHKTTEIVSNSML